MDRETGTARTDLLRRRSQTPVLGAFSLRPRGKTRQLLARTSRRSCRTLRHHHHQASTAVQTTATNSIVPADRSKVRSAKSTAVGAAAILNLSPASPITATKTTYSTTSRCAAVPYGCLAYPWRLR